MDGNAPFQTPRRAAMETAFKTPLRTPLEQTSKTPIIDMAAAIESQKENVVPRAKGRSASALHSTLTLAHRERVEKLAAQRAEHEARVRSDANAESTDPLEAWDAYVRWTIDSYPAGQTAESGLIPLLELVTRTFFTQRAWAQDIRYLRFWVLYANNCEDRRQIYKFLLANEVGTNWATLYEELANVLESNSLYDEADETYRLGIARGVHPLDRLKRRYAAFRQRIVSSSGASGTGADSADAQTYTTALKAAMAAAKRSMLGTKVDDRAGGPSLSANSVRGLSKGPAGLGAASSGPSAALAASNVKKLAVFRDEDDEDALAPKGSEAPTSGGASQWDSLGSKVQRQQENHASAKAWAGEQMGGLKKTPGKPGAAPISVFKDSDDEEEESAARASSISRTPRGASSSGRAVLAPSLSETDQLRQNPFLRWDKDLLESRPNQAAVAASKDSASLPPAETKKSKKNKPSSSSSSHKASSSPPKPRGQAADKRSSATTASSATKREIQALPILKLYPKMASLEEIVASCEAGKSRWKQRSGEKSIEQLLCAARGLSLDPEADPWSYLDQRVGVAWTPNEARTMATPDDVVMETPSEQPQGVNEPAVSSTSSSQDRTGSQKRKRDGDGDASISIKPKPKQREVTQTVTMFTKAAELDVRGMFNGDDSEDSDDDDDDDDEEESEEELSEPRNVPPTPSARHTSIPHGVPATPASQRPAIDENGDPLLMSGRRLPSVSRSGGAGVLAPRVLSDPLAALGTVSATPVRAPLLTRVPFEKVNIPGSAAPTVTSAPAPAPLAPRSVSATGPMRVPHRMEVFQEDDEEEDQEAAQERLADDDEQVQDRTPEDGEDLLINGTHVYHALTPITEATEFTRFTARSARTPATASRPCRAEGGSNLLAQWNQSRRGSARGSLARDEEDSSSEDEAEDSQIPKIMVLTDAQRKQMQVDSASGTDSGSLGGLGPSRQMNDNIFGSVSILEDEPSISNADVGNRSDASSHGFSVLQDKPLESTGQWDRPRSSPHGLSGVLIEKEDTSASNLLPKEQDVEPSLLTDQHHPDKVAAESADGFVIPNPCSPDDAEIIAHILSKLDEPIEHLPHYVDLRSQSAGGMLDQLQGAVRAATRKSMGNSSIAKNGQVKIKLELTLAGAPFVVRRKLGEGGFGAVFLADDLEGIAPSLRPQLTIGEPEDSMEIDDDDARRKVAIKVERPPNAWEFYVLHQLEARLPRSVLPSLISARKLVAYQDESYLLLHYGDKGTLLDVVNGAVSAGVASTTSNGSSVGVDEVLAMFFTIELLKIVEQMHRCRIVHGDIKIDNCLLRLDDVFDESEWTAKYSASGEGCWAAKGLILIDFGRAIDLSVYPPGQTFVAEWEADERECLQMREGKPWVFEADYYGIAAVAHTLLFGKYIETMVVKETVEGVGEARRLELAQPLRRYWQGELWTRLFDLLLNPEAVSGRAAHEPVVEELAAVREQMAEWLEANCNRAGKNLRGMLKKLELWALKRNE